MSHHVTPSPASPFEALKLTTSDGSEIWSARDLMPRLGYGADWRNFAASVERAMIAAGNTGVDVSKAFVQVTQLVDANNLGMQERSDYRLTRYAAYLVAMNGDPRKPEIAAAQTYFAVKTREAEVARPMSQLDVMAAAVAQLQEQERRTVALEFGQEGLRTGQRALEAKVSALSNEYDEYTTLAYAKLNGLPTDKVSCQKHGMRASKYMRGRGQEPRKQQNAQYGTVGIYPLDVLDATR